MSPHPPPAIAGGGFAHAAGLPQRRWATRVVPDSVLGDLLETDEPQPALPDPSFDRYARLVRNLLGVPTALVTIVERDRQIFPGAAGIPDELERTRETPLSHSFCKHVVYEQGPLIISDASQEPRVANNPAVTEFGVTAYAGMPLVDHRGSIIGSLCALDTDTRDWSEEQLAALEDLAAACSTEIVLRELRKRASDSAREAWDVSHRARVLLSVTSRLADTRTSIDVAAAVHEVATDELGCLHAGIWVVDPDNETMMNFVALPDAPWPAAEHYARMAVDDDNPFGATLLSGDPLYFSSRGPQDTAYPSLARDDLPADGHARTFLPLTARNATVGCLVLLWREEREFSDDDQLTIGALTAAVSGALDRARLLDDRTTIAEAMQRSLLTPLPRSSRLEFAARYQAARAADQVGGDWYDVVMLADGGASVMVGDVVGHDVRATAAMGPLRNMLRAFVWDRIDTPAANVTRLDRAMHDLHPGVLSTLLLAQIDAADDERQVVRWTNAGHPAPVVLRPDGRAETLDRNEIDCLLGVDADSVRHDHVAYLEPGATLLVFTDGLIERRAEHLDTGRERLETLLEENYTLSPDDLLDLVIADLVGERAFDDVAVLAVRVTR